MGSQGSLAGTVPSSDSLGNPRQALGGLEVFALPLSLPALLSPLALPMASPGWLQHRPHRNTTSVNIWEGGSPLPSPAHDYHTTFFTCSLIVAHPLITRKLFIHSLNYFQFS